LVNIKEENQVLNVELMIVPDLEDMYIQQIPKEKRK
jgi:hypothetical protein